MSGPCRARVRVRVVEFSYNTHRNSVKTGRVVPEIRSRTNRRIYTAQADMLTTIYSAALPQRWSNEANVSMRSINRLRTPHENTVLAPLNLDFLRGSRCRGLICCARCFAIE